MRDIEKLIFIYVRTFMKYYNNIIYKYFFLFFNATSYSLITLNNIIEMIKVELFKTYIVPARNSFEF
jgi:hypothetical protein